MNIKIVLFWISLSILFSSCGAKSISPTDKEIIHIALADTSSMSKAYFASGCFWCVEAIFESIEGVSEAISGYIGDHAESASYSAVSSGMSKHAESVAIYYDPKKIDYATLLNVFFDSHDPTTLNRQGPDFGFQYRSAIFYTNEDEKAMALAKIEALTASRKFDSPIVTLVDPLIKFYQAEDYHQDFEKRNPNDNYVQSVSLPRLNKFLQLHPELLKDTKH